MNDDENRIAALAKHLNTSADAIEECQFGEYTYTVENEPGEYQVLTDDEADELWEQALDSNLDDCILCELPQLAQQYFDREAWKRDARFDGRGHAINSYDGEEYEVRLADGTYMYIYRVS